MRRSGIWPHDRIVLIRLVQPHIPVPKIIEKGSEIHSRNLARPDGFRMIDVGVVVNILLAGIVIFRIAHQDEVFAGERRELLFDRLSKGLVQVIHVGKSIRVEIPLHLANLQHDRNDQQKFAGCAQPCPPGRHRPPGER